MNSPEFIFPRTLKNPINRCSIVVGGDGATVEIQSLSGSHVVPLDMMIERCGGGDGQKFDNSIGHRHSTPGRRMLSVSWHRRWDDDPDKRFGPGYVDHADFGEYGIKVAERWQSFFDSELLPRIRAAKQPHAEHEAAIMREHQAAAWREVDAILDHHGLTMRDRQATVIASGFSMRPGQFIGSILYIHAATGMVFAAIATPVDLDKQRWVDQMSPWENVRLRGRYESEILSRVGQITETTCEYDPQHGWSRVIFEDREYMHKHGERPWIAIPHVSQIQPPLGIDYINPTFLSFPGAVRGVLEEKIHTARHAYVMKFGSASPHAA